MCTFKSEGKKRLCRLRADPSQCKSTKRPNLPIQQNCLNCWTNIVILMLFEYFYFLKLCDIVYFITGSTISKKIGVAEQKLKYPSPCIALTQAMASVGKMFSFVRYKYSSKHFILPVVFYSIFFNIPKFFELTTACPDLPQGINITRTKVWNGNGNLNV